VKICAEAITLQSIRCLRYLCFEDIELMEQTCNYLFVYGTLLDEGNEFATYLRDNCRFYAKGWFKGRLYDAGEYPGAIADESHPGYVYGQVFIMTDVEEALKYLDDYEGFGDKQEQPNLFVRELIKVAIDADTLNCWVYLYNLPFEGLILIEGGDYWEYKGLNL